MNRLSYFFRYVPYLALLLLIFICSIVVRFAAKLTFLFVYIGIWAFHSIYEIMPEKCLSREVQNDNPM